MTIATQLVLQVLLADPAAELYGLEIGEKTGLPSGTIHPILARLEGLGVGASTAGRTWASQARRRRSRSTGLPDR